MANVYSVSKINAYIKGLFEEDFMLGDVSVKGEVSNLKYHSSGHIYFTLKDEKAAIACVMFQGNRSGLKFTMAEGMGVVVRGQISVYERDGKFQIYAKSITKDGAGALYEEFLRLKEELEELGMFAPEYKKPIPKSIKTLGVVTASTGAAIQDVINIATRRNPYVQIVLYPAIVQGDKAVPSIINGINALEKYGVDVMIVGRGGGSIEDLWAFNSKDVAEAVFNCSVPVISAVGHETDTTIIDFVSDLRAPTPSAAAELAVYDINSILDEIEGTKDILNRLMRTKISDARNNVKYLESNLKSLNPKNKLIQNRMYAISLEDKLNGLMKSKITDRRHSISLYAERLKGLSPLDKLSQGYSYVSAGGKTLNSISQVKAGDETSIYLKDGVVSAVVSKKSKIDYTK